MDIPEIDDFKWLEPWAPVEKRFGEAIEQQLRRKLVAGHVLFRRDIHAIARCRDQDDVLFVVESPRQFAVVHLAFARETRPDWPRTIVFASILEFIERRMLPDYESYVRVDRD